MEQPEILDNIMGLIENYGSDDGEHHKQWVLDQIVRTIQGTNYKKWVKDYCKGEDGPHTYEWGTGIAP